MVSGARFSRLTAQGLGTGQFIEGVIDGQILQRKIEDVGAGAVIALGRCRSRWCLEADLAWRYRADWDLTAPTPSLRTVVNVFSNVQTTSLIISPSYRLWGSRRRSLFASVGVGIAHHRIDTDYIERATLEVPEQFFEAERNTRDFAVSIGLRYDRQLARRWAFSSSLVYSRLGELRSASILERPASISTAKLSKLEVGFGVVRYLTR